MGAMPFCFAAGTAVVPLRDSQGLTGALGHRALPRPALWLSSIMALGTGPRSSSLKVAEPTPNPGSFAVAAKALFVICGCLSSRCPWPGVDIGNYSSTKAVPGWPLRGVAGVREQPRRQVVVPRLPRPGFHRLHWGAGSTYSVLCLTPQALTPLV